MSTFKKLDLKKSRLICHWYIAEDKQAFVFNWLWKTGCMWDGNECEHRWRLRIQSKLVEFRTKCLCVSFRKVSECTQRHSIVHTLANVIILSVKSKGLISCYRICSHLDWSHWVNVWHGDKRTGSTSKFCKSYQNTDRNLTPASGWSGADADVAIFTFHLTLGVWPVNNILLAFCFSLAFIS